MKNRLFLSLLALAAVTASAQTPVTGTVVDKNKRPIPGATVELPGTDRSVLTNIDGSFTINDVPEKGKLTARFVGLQSKTQLAKDSMIIVLRKGGFWRWKPERWQFFMALQGGVVDSECNFWDSFKRPAIGLTIGAMKKWGFYGKVMMTPGLGEQSHFNETDWFTGNTRKQMLTAVGGLMIHTGTPFYIHAGVGYMDTNVGWEKLDGTYAKYEDDHYSGVCFDAGLTLRLGKHFLLNGGYLYGNKKAQAPYLGIGCAF